MPSRTGHHIAATLGGQWTKFAVQLAALVVFSRLLSPTALGLIAMVTAVTSVASVVGDFGLSLAAIQARALTQAQKSNLFWTNSALGLLIAAVIVAVSPTLATFYREPTVQPVAAVISVIFALNGIAVQYRVELNRASRFNVLALADGGSQLLGFVVGLIMIILGFGYWSLVWMQITAAITALAVVMSAARWTPSFPSRKADMRALFHFGTFTFLTQVINYLSSNVDTVFIGRIWGAGFAGLYSRAYQLAFQPTLQIASPLTRIFLPLLSSATPGLDSRNRLIKTAQSTFVYVIVGILSLMAGSSYSTVPFILGAKWRGSVPLVVLLAIAGAFQSAGYIYYWLLLAAARTRTLFYAELGARIIMIALIMVLAAVGPVWVALAVAIGQLLVTVALAATSGPRVGITHTLLLGTTIRPFVAYTFAAAAAWFAANESAALGLTTALQSICSVVVWLVACGLIYVVTPAIRADLAPLVAKYRSSGRAS